MTATVAQIESAGYRAWSPDEVANIDGWIAVSNGGFTRRVNSASTTTSASTSPETGKRIEEWLGNRRAPMTIRVTPLVPDELVEECSAAWNLSPLDETAVLVAEARTADDGGVVLVDPGNPSFVVDLFRLNGRDESGKPAWDRLIERLGTHGIGLWLPGRAVGLVAVVNGVGLVYSVAVDEEHRRQGLALRIMSAANSWATDAGASTMSLQVVGTNDAASALYDTLGYQRLYSYHYLQRPADQ
ncbi:MAG: GNAT family N-acetyltransferase [Acidimicrobiia bacterium]